MGDEGFRELYSITWPDHKVGSVTAHRQVLRISIVLTGRSSE